MGMGTTGGDVDGDALGSPRSKAKFDVAVNLDLADIVDPECPLGDASRKHPLLRGSDEDPDKPSYNGLNGPP